MIDERINKSLTEIETQLRNLESARVQVDKTVNAFDELNSTTKDYVSSLNEIYSKLADLINLVGEDYTKNVSEFKKDRAEIINSTNNLLERIDNTANDVKKEIYSTIKFQKIMLWGIFSANMIIMFVLIIMLLLR